MLLRFDTILCSNLRTKTLLRAISNVHTGRRFPTPGITVGVPDPILFCVLRLILQQLWRWERSCLHSFNGWVNPDWAQLYLTDAKVGCSQNKMKGFDLREYFIFIYNKNFRKISLKQYFDIHCLRWRLRTRNDEDDLVSICTEFLRQRY